MRARSPIASAARDVQRVADHLPAPYAAVAHEGHGSESKVESVDIPRECDEFEQGWTGHDHPHRVRLTE